MIRVLQWLIFGHVHKWEDAGIPVATYEFSDSDRPYKREQPMRCARCGARKKFAI